MDVILDDVMIGWRMWISHLEGSYDRC